VTTLRRVVVAGRARLAIVCIADWWAANRPKAPHLFDEELQKTLELLAAAPTVGEAWPSKRVPGVRRWLLRRTRYHAYYTVDEEQATGL